MSEQGTFETASGIASKIASYCDSDMKSKEMIKLVKELLEIRWAISPKQSS